MAPTVEMPPEADFSRRPDGGAGLPKEGRRPRCQQRSITAAARRAGSYAPSSRGCSGRSH